MTRPDILFVLIDDLGWKDLSCCGSTFYETPHLDGLAAQGMRFTNAYASCPVCSPTRASILSGKYPARVGLTNYIDRNHPSRGRLIDAPYIDHLPLEEICLARALKKGGYATYHVGKWHLGLEPFFPENHGFDVNIGGCECGYPVDGYFGPFKHLRMAGARDNVYLTDHLTDEAIGLIRATPRGKPFFMNLCHYAVHIPLQVRPEWLPKYVEKAKRLGLDSMEALREGEFFPCEHKKNKRVVRRLIQSDPAYAAMVDNLDWNIGRLLKALAESGRADNTMVVFTSDNGGLSTAEGSPTSNAPLNEGKGWMYEGGTRAPLIVRYPERVPRGAVCSVPVTSPDFYPTFLETAGLDLLPGQHKDGVSLLPLLSGKGNLAREAIFWHYPHYGNQGGTPGSSVRSGDWKLIEFFEDGQLELYNLKDDQGETRNLAADKPEMTRRLRGLLANWRKEIEAKIPAVNPAWTRME